MDPVTGAVAGGAAGAAAGATTGAAPPAQVAGAASGTPAPEVGKGAAGQVDAGTKGWWETPGTKLDLKPPQGMELSKDWETDIQTWAGKHHLTPEAVNEALPLIQKWTEGIKKNNGDAFTSTVSGWKTEAAKEHGATHEQAKKDAAGVVGKFGDKRVNDLFNTFGVGENPGLFAMLAKVGAFIREKVSEDTSGAGKGATGGATTTPQDPKSRRMNAIYTHPSSTGQQKQK